MGPPQMVVELELTQSMMDSDEDMELGLDMDQSKLEAWSGPPTAPTPKSLTPILISSAYTPALSPAKSVDLHGMTAAD
jgi:hypothetical protein